MYSLEELIMSLLESRKLSSHKAVKTGVVMFVNYSLSSFLQNGLLRLLYRYVIISRFTNYTQQCDHNVAAEEQEIE